MWLVYEKKEKKSGKVATTEKESNKIIINNKRKIESNKQKKEVQTRLQTWGNWRRNYNIWRISQMKKLFTEDEWNKSRRFHERKSSIYHCIQSEENRSSFSIFCSLSKIIVSAFSCEWRKEWSPILSFHFLLKKNTNLKSPIIKEHGINHQASIS